MTTRKEADDKRRQAAESGTKQWRDALRLALMREVPGSEGKRFLHMIAERCVLMAVNGDINAIREIGQRMDGMPTVEATVTVKKDINEFSDAELELLIRSAAGRGGDHSGEDTAASPSNGSGKPSRIH